VKCVPLTEDGSNRQYFRVFSSNPSSAVSFILMQLHGQDASDLKSESYSWITISNVLKAHEIFVPNVHSLIKDYDSLLIEDFGDTTLDLKVKNATETEIHSLYSSAVQNICKFIVIKPALDCSWSKRGFDYALLHRELEFFKAQFLDSLPEVQNKNNSSHFSKEIESLSTYLSQVPQFFTHRDFHSRNLMLVNNKLGVIDFQDARWGPLAYDLCSLCFDPYVDLSFHLRESLFKEALNTIGLKNGMDIRDNLVNTWQAVLLQRMLKAIGSFAFLTRKGKKNYRVYIAPTLSLLHHFLDADSPWPYLVHELIPKLMKLPHEKAA
jgi:aminoglycoside/choline kinase family phosphotransferase